MGDFSDGSTEALERQKSALVLSLYDLLYSESRSLSEQNPDDKKEMARIQSMSDEQHGEELKNNWDRVDIMIQELCKLDPELARHTIDDIKSNENINMGMRMHVTAIDARREYS